MKECRLNLFGSEVNMNDIHMQDEIYNLIDEYLEFSGLIQTLKLFRRENLQKKAIFTPSNSEIAKSILTTLDHGDYPAFIGLWDKNITNLTLSMGSEVVDASLRIELLGHVILATFPFRLSQVEKVGSPKAIAAVAARSMTIYKHYIESRGFLVIQKYKDLNLFKNLFKIAFPPTHPTYKHIFRIEWIQSSLGQIKQFLESILCSNSVPKIVKLLKTNVSLRRKVKEVKSDESKLLGLTTTLLDVSNDILVSAERGKPLSKSLVSKLRSRFDELKTLFEESHIQDNDSHLSS